MKIREFISRIVLNPNDTQKYNRIVSKIHKLKINAEYNAYYGQILKVDHYSYDVKQKAVLWLYTLQQSRLWGFKNLSDEGLLVFVQEYFNYEIGKIGLEDLQALVSNPAFAGSVNGNFNVPKMIFARLFAPMQPAELIREELLGQLVISPNMNLGVAEVIVKCALQGATECKEKWAGNESLVLNWTRNTYDMGDLPDSWVRQFLTRVV